MVCVWLLQRNARCPSRVFIYWLTSKWCLSLSLYFDYIPFETSRFLIPLSNFECCFSEWQFASFYTFMLIQSAGEITHNVCSWTVFKSLILRYQLSVKSHRILSVCNLSRGPNGVDITPNTEFLVFQHRVKSTFTIKLVSCRPVMLHQFLHKGF